MNDQIRVDPAPGAPLKHESETETINKATGTTPQDQVDERGRQRRFDEAKK